MMLGDVRPAPGAHVRRSGPSPWRHLDPLLITAVVAIAAFGCLMVYTATRVEMEVSGLSPYYDVKKQAEFVVLGLGVMFAVAAVDYRRYRDWAPALYGLSIFLLVAVYGVGRRVSGAQAWFQIGPYQFEPSEFAKVALIVALAAYASNFKGSLPRRAVLTVLALSVVPFALVYKQPDLGTALVLLAVLLAVLMIAGASVRQLGALALIGVIAVTAVVELGVLKSYQKARLTSFLNTPDKVSQTLLRTDAGANIYNLVESKNAISHGGLLGQGIGKGSATNLSQVPEQQTDFIFSAAGEQVGLVGCAILLALFLLVVWRTWVAATLSRDLFGTLVCVGVMAMLVFQIFENIGMTMGIMPVAGIPLPWMSYGGSALLIEFAAIGLVLNVRMRRFS
jgi:rod shape determining protein RodA